MAPVSNVRTGRIKYCLPTLTHRETRSGQGPYFGQKAWFSRFHHEQLPSAVERYENEIKRVVKVIDNHLAKTGTGYLVGNKCTYADLAFASWDSMIPFLLGEDGSKKLDSENTHFAKWHQSIMSRPAVSKVFADKQKAMAEGK